MSLYPSKLKLSPSVCHHFLCLLLLLTHSSTASEKALGPASPPTQHNSTQANCFPACDNGGVSENATVKSSSETRSTEVATLLPQKNLNSTSVSSKLHDTIASVIPTSQSEEGKHSSTASSSSQQQAPPETVTHPAALSPTTKGSPSQAAHTGSVTSTGVISSTPAEPVRNVQTTPVLSSTPATKTTPTSATNTTLVRHETTKQSVSTTATTTTTTSTITATTTTKTTLTRAVTTVTVTTATSIKESLSQSSSAAIPQPNASNAEMPPVETTSLPTGPATRTVTSTITPSTHNDAVASGTRIAVVEVAGVPLSRQLVDTASLLAVLLIGLLFFLVTVAVFVTQAYESYRRKDYTQVDYLINGMYTDSGV